MNHFQNCHHAAQYIAANSCPSGYEFYEDTCYKVGLTVVSFEEAEITCLPDPGESGLYQSELMWTTEQHHYEYIGRIVKEKTGEEAFWIGLDDRSNSGTWETSLGNQNIAQSHPFWKAGSTGFGYKKCGIIPGPNGGYFTPDLCEELHPFVCQTKPLTSPPDNSCPLDYVPYKGKCIRFVAQFKNCLLYTSPSPRDRQKSRMPSSA